MGQRHAGETLSDRGPRTRVLHSIIAVLAAALLGLVGWVIIAFGITGVIVATVGPDADLVSNRTLGEALYSVAFLGPFITISYGHIGIPVCIGLAATIAFVWRRWRTHRAG